MPHLRSNRDKCSPTAVTNPEIGHCTGGQQAAPQAVRCRRTSPQKLVLQTTRHRVPCQITHAAQQAPTSSEPDAVLCEARSTNAARQTYPRRTSSRSVPHATHFGASLSVGLPFAGATTRTPRFFKRRSARMRSDSSVSPTDQGAVVTPSQGRGRRVETDTQRGMLPRKWERNLRSKIR